MSIRSVDAVERSVHKTNEWLSELAAELGGEDREDAWRQLRVYLQLLREQLTVDEAAQLAAQLTYMLRGVFYDGFDPSRQPHRLRHREELLAAFAERAQVNGAGAAERCIEAATRVLDRHVTGGELDDVLAQLPTEIQEVLQHG